MKVHGHHPMGDRLLNEGRTHREQPDDVKMRKFFMGRADDSGRFVMRCRMTNKQQVDVLLPKSLYSS